MVVIGGDHNSSIETGESENWEMGVSGARGIGKTKGTGTNLLYWCQTEAQSLISF